MKWLDEFKNFVQRGNVIDLAVAVIIGAAFNKIVTSLVTEMIMPIIGIITNGINIATLSYSLHNPLTGDTVALKYGSFLQSVLDFLIIAFCVFWLVKGVNAVHKKDPKPEELPAQEKLLAEIRDLLKTQQPGSEIKTSTGI